MCNLHVYMYRQDNVFQALNFRLISILFYFYSNTLPHEFHKNIVLHHIPFNYSSHNEIHLKEHKL